jgi:hypothetical protein
MTLEELQLLYRVLSVLRILPEERGDSIKALNLVKREIELRTMDPRKKKEDD